jgi:predicted AAA+ superfamily ATPase
MYYKRHIEGVLQRYSKEFPSILVTGARQVGKSTLLNTMYPTYNSITFDNLSYIQAIKDSPDEFFDIYKYPIILDEVQKAPEIFLQLKIIIDKNKEKGNFYLTGSEQFELMKNVSESLSGRIGILNLMGLSLREKLSNANTNPFNENFLGNTGSHKVLTQDELWYNIHRGSQPELFENNEFNSNDYFGSYIETYIERDVKKLINISDLSKFRTFLQVLAARTSQQLNITNIANDSSISTDTVARWISILETSNIVYLLKPYYNNFTNRITKTSKIYFRDTGLAAYLLKWTSPDTLRNGAMKGAFFETFVVMEILKSYLNFGINNPPLYYYRDKEKKEIDLLIENNGSIIPVEIKAKPNATIDDCKSFSVVNKIPNIIRNKGAVITAGTDILPLGNNNYSLPIFYV